MPKRVRVSYGRTVQSAPYESIRMDVAIEKDVPDGESVIEAVNKSVNGLREYVTSKIQETLTLEDN